MVNKLAQRLQTLVVDGTLDGVDAERLLGDIDSDSRVTRQEYSWLREAFTANQGKLTDEARLKIENFLKEREHHRQGLVRPDGQGLFFSSVVFFEDDPSLSTLRNETIPVEWLGVDDDGIPLDGPTGPRVRVLFDEDSPWRAIADEQGLFRLPEGADAKHPSVRAMNAFVATNKALALAEKSYGAKINWGGADGQLDISMDTEPNDFNASFSPAHERLNFRESPLTDPAFRDSLTDAEKQRLDFFLEQVGEGLHLAVDTEVVYHESGHALLETLMPGFLADVPDRKAFHEAFGDIRAFMGILRNPTAFGQEDWSVEELLAAADPNNPDAHLAHHTPLDLVHLAVLGTTGQGPTDPARHVLNDAVFDPNDRTDPVRGGSHFFSKVITGAAFSTMVGMRAQSEEGIDDFDKLAMRSLDLIDAERFTLPEWARGMLRADLQLFDGAYSEVIAEEMIRRKLLTPEEVESVRAEATTGLSVFPQGLPSWFQVDRQETIEAFVNAHHGELDLRDGREYRIVNDFARGKKGGRVILQAPLSPEWAAALDTQLEQLFNNAEAQGAPVSTEEQVYLRELYTNFNSPRVHLTLDDEGQVLFARAFDASNPEHVSATTPSLESLLDLIRGEDHHDH